MPEAELQKSNSASQGAGEVTSPSNRPSPKMYPNYYLHSEASMPSVVSCPMQTT